MFIIYLFYLFDHSARAQLQGLNNVLQHQMVPGYLEFQYLNATLPCASTQTPRVNAAFQYPYTGLK